MMVRIMSLTMKIILCLFLLVSAAKFMFWLWPEARVLNLAMLAILSVDYALIISGIKPKGFESWFRKER
jgi:hypothetical protein